MFGLLLMVLCIFSIMFMLLGYIQVATAIVVIGLSVSVFCIALWGVSVTRVIEIDKATVRGLWVAIILSVLTATGAGYRLAVTREPSRADKAESSAIRK